jgi:hypothetical protein
MEWGWILGGGTAAVLAVIGAWWGISRRKFVTPAQAVQRIPIPSAGTRGGQAPSDAVPVAPDTLLIGESPERAVVAIRSTTSREGFQNAVTLDLKSDLLTRFSSVLQAAPALLVASETAGKRLMEVVIRGDLTAAADGNGFRAFAMEGNKIVEHGKLFDAGKLQTMVNAAAVWQVASVLVAQKHLADISQKLNEIKSAVQSISKFLDQQRRARIHSTYDYLVQVARTIAAGELSASARGELESCERDLLEIHCHLLAQFRDVAGVRVEHKETVGTEDLTREIAEKIRKLDDIVADMHMCLRTRIGAWHVLSAFPGEANLIAARRASIETSFDEIRELAPLFSTELDQDIEQVKSKFNRQVTLDARKGDLRDKRDRAKQTLSENSSQLAESIRNTMNQLLLQNQPTRILLAVDNGRIVGARQAVAQAAQASLQ